MALLALVVGVITALTTRRLKPALVAGISVWVLVTLFLTVGVRALNDDQGSEHAVTAGFWVFQFVALLATVGATVATARLRSRDAVRTA